METPIHSKDRFIYERVAFLEKIEIEERYDWRAIDFWLQQA